MQLRNAAVLVKELQELVKSGMRKAALSFDRLVEEELITAFQDDDKDMRMKARHYLMDIIVKAIPVSDDIRKRPIDSLIASFDKFDKVSISGEHVASESPRSIIDATYTTVT